MGHHKDYNAEELDEAVEKYFRKIQTRKMLKDEAGEPERDLDGEIMYETRFRVPPSIADLCVFLHISKRTWCSYSHCETHKEICEDAKLRIEAFLYKDLNTKKNPNGTIFNLQNNYDMAERHQVDATAGRMSLTDRMDLIRKAAAGLPDAEGEA